MDSVTRYSPEVYRAARSGLRSAMRSTLGLGHINPVEGHVLATIHGHMEAVMDQVRRPLIYGDGPSAAEVVAWTLGATAAAAVVRVRERRAGA